MTILLAEDDNFFQNFYSKKLTEQGIGVKVAKDGAEAIEILKTLRPNLILLDLIMPNKDGFEVLAERAKNEELKKIPVLIFSTLGQEQDVEKAKALGATDYVNKTFFDFGTLLAKINSLASQQA